MTRETISGHKTISGGEKFLLAGRYRPVRKLSPDNMGSVWLAKDTELYDRKVAIKMLPSILVSSRSALQQLKSEALVSLKLTHPNIATLRSFEENDGNPFLVMDFIDGHTLDDLLAEKGSLREDEALALLRPVAAAIDYAHREKVVHRDVKPSNVMVRTDGTPFVLDFGIAREIQETKTDSTGAGSSGTLMYMSPEQLNGAAPTPAQDVYSFAAMAYECLAGKPPFHSGQIKFQILNDPPPPLPSDSAFAQGILRGLAKDPAARPSSCLAVLGEAASALQRTQAQVMIHRPIQRADALAAVPVASRAVRMDADVYLLEEESKSLLERTVEKYATSVARDLDAGLVKAKSVCRAALNALHNGDVEAARKLFSEFLAYPAQRTAHATRLALKAFDHDRFEEAIACAAEADAQNAGIRFLRGYCYQTGSGVEKDLAKARTEYRAAAEQGFPAAQFNYATLLHRGEGGDVNIAEALKWYEAAAAQGEADACLALAALYDGGVSVPRDATKAFGFLLKADRQGALGCAPMLGTFCARNEDVGLSTEARDTYLRAAAAAGNERAQKILEEKTAREEAERLAAERKAEAVRRAVCEAAERKGETARREAARRAAEAARRAAESARLEAERRAEEARRAAARAAARAKRVADLRRIGGKVAKIAFVLALVGGFAFAGVQTYRRLAAERAACSDYRTLCQKADGVRRELVAYRADGAGLSNGLYRADVALKVFGSLPENVGRTEVSNCLAAAREAWCGLESAHNWLVTNRPLRDVAVRARRSLDDATTNRLQSIEAAVVVPDDWTKLETLRADWRTAFDRGDFAQVENIHTNLAQQTENTIAAAKLVKDKCRQLDLAAKSCASELAAQVDDEYAWIEQQSDEVKALFEEEIRVFETERQTGNEANKNEKYVMTTNSFTQALAKATALKILMAGREAFLAGVEKAEDARRAADAVGAETAFLQSYNEAKKMLPTADDVDKTRNFSVAATNVLEAAGRFVALRAKVVSAALDDAKQHRDAAHWEDCLMAAKKVLGWEAENAEAKALMVLAESNLVPSLKLVVRVEGRKVEGAEVVIDGKVYLSPVVLKDLKTRNRLTSLSAFYEEGGKRYRKTFPAIDVDWTGLRVLPLNLPEVFELQAGDVKEFELSGGVKMKFVWCPPNSFMMGSLMDEEERKADETPHRVRLTKGFWLGQYEVKQEEWRSVMGSNPSKFKGDNRPVEQVSWEDCKKFIDKCNEAASGVRFALPTEAQWEYACRAGSSDLYAGVGRLDEVGWYEGNSETETHPVGLKKPNEWKLYDMHGNVSEWCEDWYGAYDGNATDPTGPDWGWHRVLRGGSWDYSATLCRSAARIQFKPGHRSHKIGFRLVCTAESHE